MIILEISDKYHIKPVNILTIHGKGAVPLITPGTGPLAGLYPEGGLLGSSLLMKNVTRI